MADRTDALKTLALHTRFDFLIGDIARLHSRRFDRAAREKLGLTLAQLRLLWTLGLQPSSDGVTQQALAELLEMTKMGVGLMCSRLEAAGWIRRRGLDSDRRVRIVTLTPSTLTVLEKAIALADMHQDEMLSTVPARQRAQLLSLLQSVHDILVD